MNSMNGDGKEEPRWEEGAAAVSPDPTWMPVPYVSWVVVGVHPHLAMIWAEAFMVSPCR